MSDTDTEDVNPNLSWKIPCRNCILHIHAGGVTRHYANKHPNMEIPYELRAKHLEYRRFRRLVKTPCTPTNNARRPAPPYRRSYIQFLKWSPSKIEPFINFLKSDFGGSLEHSYARELGVMYGKLVCFEYEDTKQVDELSDAQRDADLCNEGRILRLLDHLDKSNARSSTRQKWLHCLLKATAWRAHLIRKEKEQTLEMQERLKKLESVEPHWSKYKSALYKRKTKEQRLSAKSVDERKEDGNWCSTEEWKAAVEAGFPPFQTIVDKAKLLTPGSLPVHDYVAAINFCLALYFCENRPQRPGFLSALTMEEWAQIEEKKSYSTRAFKTSALYGEQHFTFGDSTLKTWKLYAEFIRPHAPRNNLFFVTSNGRPIKVSRCLSDFSYATMSRHITATTLRAVVATEAEDKLGPEEAQKVHRADTHSIQTVKRHYDKRAAERAAEAADVVYTRLVGAPVHLPELDVMMTAMQQDGDVPELDVRTTAMEQNGDVDIEMDAPPQTWQLEPPPQWELASPPSAKGVFRIAFSKNEVLFISKFGRQPIHNWSKALTDGRAKGILHSKRSAVNLKDCWRCVQKGTYLKKYGIDTNGYLVV